MFDLTADDSWALHHLRNLLLVSITFAFLPFTFLVTLFASLLHHAGITKVPRKVAPPHFDKPPRALITGVGMCKGLFLARTMYLGGCVVFGGDFDKPLNLHCGRFSNALQKFFVLKNPSKVGVKAYVDQVVEVINQQKIDLWISCSGVATAVEDAVLAEEIARRTQCKVFQLDQKSIETLDDKLRFMRKTDELGLVNLRWFALESQKGIPAVWKKVAKLADEGEDIQFMIKAANMDDATRGILPLLSANDLRKMEEVLKSLDYANGRQWILQEFISSGEEYCTHAIVINGKIRAFTACPSASVLMHYKQLDASSLLFKQMRKFTEDYAKGLGDITGHMSFDFLVRYKEVDGGFQGTLVPIECNPRCHTATVCFEGQEAALAERYLEILSGVKGTPTLGTTVSDYGFYWMAHDIVVLGLGSLLGLASGDLKSLRTLLDCMEHLVSWRDNTFLWWDPVPWFVLNQLYWPWELINASMGRTKWKQLNISTTKMFKA